MNNKNWHKKPPKSVRSVEDALRRAEINREEIPHIAQVLARDWDLVLLADEVKRLRKAQEK